MNWLKIPGYDDYALSSTGVIRNDKTGTIRKLNATPDGYLYLTISKKGKKYALYPHKLVCLLFNGGKPTDKHVVNHKDGVKTNNYHSNLEWVTYSENTKHAFMMGLHPIARQIRVIDTTNGNVMECKSMNEVEGIFGVRKYNIAKYLAAGNDELYQDRYLFEISRESKRFSQLGDVAIYDYRTQEQTFVNSIPLAQINTGIEHHLIKKALKQGGLVNGVGFRYMDGNAHLTMYTEADIAASVAEYGRDRTYWVKNYLTDEVIAYDTVVEIAEYFDVIPDAIYGHLKRDTPTLYRAHHIQQGSAEFPEYSIDRIVVSQLWGNMPTRPIKVITKSTGSEDYHTSIFALGKELGISNSQMDRYAKGKRMHDHELIFI